MNQYLNTSTASKIQNLKRVSYGVAYSPEIVAALDEQSNALRESALAMADTPAALQLQYLQTLTCKYRSAKRYTTTVVFPFPIDLMSTSANGFGNSDGAHKIALPQKIIAEHL
uniref:Porphobilinogen synthase n=1 Tax=Panagrellus redivivus TaxID=6233 RepID=A0A7E4UXL1_PANRE